jgi:hypothetical protein
MMKMFNKVSSEELFGILTDCLENGIANQEDANYMIENRGLMLLVAKMDNYIEVYANGDRVLRLDYLQNNVDWDEANLGGDRGHPFKGESYSTTVIKLYRGILEGKGLHVIREEKAKYLN